MGTAPNTPSAKERFIEYLQARDMRITSERISIIDVISKLTGFFTIEELHTMMIREAFNVSTATLYNTIELLLDARLLKCLRFSDRTQAVYKLDPGDTVRVYQVCELCGSIKESSPKSLTRYIKHQIFTGIEPHSFALTIYGVCRKCRRK